MFNTVLTLHFRAMELEVNFAFIAEYTYILVVDVLYLGKFAIFSIP